MWIGLTAEVQEEETGENEGAGGVIDPDTNSLAVGFSLKFFMLLRERKTCHGASISGGEFKTHIHVQ